MNEFEQARNEFDVARSVFYDLVAEERQRIRRQNAKFRKILGAFLILDLVMVAIGVAFIVATDIL
jgi:hypothetical protein